VSEKDSKNRLTKSQPPLRNLVSGSAYSTQNLVQQSKQSLENFTAYHNESEGSQQSLSSGGEKHK
jgi:hypothetical protein